MSETIYPSGEPELISPVGTEVALIDAGGGACKKLTLTNLLAWIFTQIKASNLTVTGSTETAKSSTASSTNASFTITLLQEVSGITAGTYTLTALLQALVNKSHTHTVSSYTLNCNCVTNCNCDCSGGA